MAFFVFHWPLSICSFVLLFEKSYFHEPIQKRFLCHSITYFLLFLSVVTHRYVDNPFSFMKRASIQFGRS